MLKNWLGAVCLFWACSSVWAVNDPMRPPFFDGSNKAKIKVSVNKPLELTMILNGAKRKVAVINGVSVQEGDSVSGYRILSISQHKVVVTRKGKVKDVFLGKSQQRGKTKVVNRNKTVED